MNRTPVPNSITPVHAPPNVIPINSVSTLDSTTRITTAGPVPTIVRGSRSNTGTIYGGASVDGSASAFFYGSSSTADAQLGFDDRLGLSASGTTPPNGLAVFRFAGLTISSAPTVATTNGPLDLALVANNGMNVGGTGGTWNVGALRSLFLGTENASLTLNSKLNFTASSFSGFRALHLYGRGGDVTLGGSYNLPAARLTLDSDEKAILSSTASVNADELLMHGIKGVGIAGSATANYAQIWSDDQITVSKALNAKTLYTKSHKIGLLTGGSISGQDLSFETSGDFEPGAAGTLITAANGLDLKVGETLTLNTIGSGSTRFNIANTNTLRVEAKKLIVPQSIALANGRIGILKGGAEGVNAAGYNLTGFEQVALDGGNIAVHNLDSRQISTINGNVTATGNLSAEHATIDGDLKVAGTIHARSGSTASTPHDLTAKSFEAGGGLNFRGANAGLLLSTPTGGGWVRLNSTEKDIVFETTSGRIAGANLDGGSAAGLLNFTEGGDGGTLEVGTDAAPTAGDIAVKGAISATTGVNSGFVSHGGKGGTVKMVSAKKIDIQDRITVSASTGSAKSRQGGNIRLESHATSGSAISVNNSGQLLSLLNSAAPGSGGKVEFVSAGGDITVNGSMIQADKGTVELRNNGTGNIALTNATLRGDVVKANVLGANGQLIVGGGSIDANSAIKLYASGANGTVRFNDNVTLNGNSVKTIAGNTVSIDNGKTVTVNGPAAARVYTNNANYSGSGGNGSTSGQFGGRGATTSVLSAAPAY